MSGESGGTATAPPATTPLETAPAETAPVETGPLEASFRSVMGNLASGVTIVTVASDVVHHGMTANAVMSVSLRPPLVAVALADRSYTNALVTGCGHFTVNVLGEDQREVALRFAVPLARGPQLFGEPPLRLGPTGDPLVEGCIAYLACEVASAHVEGDHTLYVGRVAASWQPAGERSPLVFHRSTFRSTSCHCCLARQGPMQAWEIFYDSALADLSQTAP